jgi:anthranilate phosphoribosyltransferase
MQSFSDVLNRLAEPDFKAFSRQEAFDALSFIVRGDANEAQTAAFLFGMRQKGETIDELTGFVQAMRKAMISIDVDVSGAVDVCGTGGDHSGSFNISTAAMFVVAGAGVPVAKHGNRSISSKSGSSDVLTALGGVAELPPEAAARCFEETGLCFMFAPLFHPAMKYVMPARRNLSMRTFFNIMGPLLNPAGVKRQMLGTYNDDVAQLCAGILKELGSEAAFTVHSEDGMDELSTAAASRAYPVCNGELGAPLDVTPESLGLRRITHDEIKGGDQYENAEIIRNILHDKATEAQRDIVLLNAAYAIQAGGKADSAADGLTLARESIRSGNAAQKLDAFCEATQRLKPQTT